MATDEDMEKAFLKQHSQVLVGREAWTEANKGIELDDTFTEASKPTLEDGDSSNSITA
ncbi:hypothetical protein MY11210_007639 [Beauveria gryllotalpidicola]